MLASTTFVIETSYLIFQIFAVQFENWSVIQPLLGKGADPKHVVLPSGNTAMHYCAERHHVNSVKRLAEAGASVTHPNIEYGFTPIDSALRTYEEELITYGEDSRPNIFGDALAVIMELKVYFLAFTTFSYLKFFSMPFYSQNHVPD